MDAWMHGCVYVCMGDSTYWWANSGATITWRLATDDPSLISTKAKVFCSLTVFTHPFTITTSSSTLVTVSLFAAASAWVVTEESNGVFRAWETLKTWIVWHNWMQRRIEFTEGGPEEDELMEEEEEEEEEEEDHMGESPGWETREDDPVRQ